MDISTRTIGEGLPSQALLGETFTELIPFIEPHVTTGPEPTIISEDVFQAVKLDPAVLEAKVALENSGRSSVMSGSGDGLSTGHARAPPAATPGSRSQFKNVVDMQQAALLSLTPQQFDLLMKFADTLRKQRLSNQMSLECAFCKNNGESVAWYSSHGLRSWRGWVQCPVLRAYHCPRCGATGDRAHTIKYCPENYQREGVKRIYRSPN